MQGGKAQDAVHKEAALEGILGDGGLEDVVDEGNLAGFNVEGGVGIGGVEPQQLHVVVIGTVEAEGRLVDDDEF